MTSSKKRKISTNYIILTATVFLGFLVFGFSENIKGPAIPRIQSEFVLTEGHVGLMLALNSFGYLVACGYTGGLSKKTGLKATTIMCFTLMAFSGILIFYSERPLTFMASYFLMYLGNGMLEISLGLIAARIFLSNTGTLMNISHFFYGFSSMIAPLAATSLMNRSFSGNILGWRGMYLIMLLACLIPVIPALIAKFPGTNENHPKRLSARMYAKDHRGWLIVAILSFGVVCEMAVGGWMVNFLEKAYGFDPVRAASYLSAFFFCFMLARLLFGPFIDKIGFIRSLMILSLFSGVAIIIAVLTGERAAFLLVLAGFGIAPIYPTVMALLAVMFPESIDTAMTFTLIIMGVAIVLGNMLVGVVVDFFRVMFTGILGPEAGIRLGYSGGYFFIGLCSIFCFVMTYILYKTLLAKNQKVL